MKRLPEKTRALLHALLTPSCILDQEERVVAANDAFVHMAKVAGIERGGRALSECVKLPADCRIRDLVFVRGMPFKTGEIRAADSLGGELWLRVSALPQQRRGGNVTAALILFEDMTKERTLADQNRRAASGRAAAGGRADSRDGGRGDPASMLNLEKAYADMNEELEMARSIQEGLMPETLPDALNLKSSALYIPAGKVGGDFYDMIITPHQKAAVLIFDVSGHGVPAALIGAMAKMLFLHYIDKIESPAQIFAEVNSRICKFVKSEHYLTAFLGIINPIENTMVYSKAGHVPPVVYHAGTGEVTSLRARGFFIGHAALAAIARFSEETIALDAGDKLLFYTDGLTEGSNQTGELYGNDRLLEAARKNGMRSPGAFLDAILEDQTRFRNGCPLRDDFTMLCVETGSAERFFGESGFSPNDKPAVLVASAYPMVEEVASVILREMDRKGFPDKDIKRMKICIFEVVTNAIEHGNHADPAKKAIVAYKVTAETASVSVTDEGRGFDYTHLPDPLAPENILLDHGRGLFIVGRYMDEVLFNKKGNRVMIVKHRHGKG